LVLSENDVELHEVAPRDDLMEHRPYVHVLPLHAQCFHCALIVDVLHDVTQHAQLTLHEHDESPTSFAQDDAQAHAHGVIDTDPQYAPSPHGVLLNVAIPLHDGYQLLLLIHFAPLILLPLRGDLILQCDLNSPFHQCLHG
jgi:hypothetical protein